MRFSTFAPPSGLLKLRLQFCRPILDGWVFSGGSLCDCRLPRRMAHHDSAVCVRLADHLERDFAILSVWVACPEANLGAG
jgi:hypothetical protein